MEEGKVFSCQCLAHPRFYHTQGVPTPREQRRKREAGL